MLSVGDLALASVYWILPWTEEKKEVLILEGANPPGSMAAAKAPADEGGALVEPVVVGSVGVSGVCSGCDTWSGVLRVSWTG